MLHRFGTFRKLDLSAFLFWNCDDAGRKVKVFPKLFRTGIWHSRNSLLQNFFVQFFNSDISRYVVIFTFMRHNMRSGTNCCLIVDKFPIFHRRWIKNNFYFVKSFSVVWTIISYQKGKKQKSFVKRIHLVTDDGLHDRKAS